MGIQEGEVTLTGTILGKATPILPAGTKPGLTAKNIVATLTNITKAAITLNVTNIVEAFNSLLDLGNASSDIKEGFALFKSMVALGKSINDLGGVDDKAKAEKALTAMNNFFSNSTKSGGSASLSIVATANLHGGIKTTSDYGDDQINISTPGSKDSHLNPQENYNKVTDANGIEIAEYPSFNEILGTFALLKKPVINISYQPFNEDPPNAYNSNNPYHVQWNRIRFKIPKTYTENGLTVNNPVLYALNPIMHANYTTTKIKVALMVKEKMGSGGENFSFNTGIFNNYPLVNFSSVQANYPNLIDVITPLTYDGSEIYAYNHSWQPGANHNSTYNSYEFISPLVPLDYIYDMQGEMTLFGSNFHPDDIWGFPFNPSIDEVRLKFFIDFESNEIGSNGQPNRSTLVFTYPLEVKMIPEFPIISTIDYNQTRPKITSVTQSQMNQFCTTSLENTTYRAKDVKQLRAQSPSNVIYLQDQKDKPKDDMNTSDIDVFPNPAKTVVNLKYKVEKEASVSLSIYNMQMQKVLGEINLGRKSKGQFIESINVNKLSSGSYIMLLRVGDRTLRIKTVITK